MDWNIYLSGEIHSNWREEIIETTEKEHLPIKFFGPVTDHDASDDCGVKILGHEENKFWHDNKGAKINAIRTRKGIEQSDIVVVKFGEKYEEHLNDIFNNKILLILFIVAISFVIYSSFR